jgi:hypothetical protein
MSQVKISKLLVQMALKHVRHDLLIPDEEVHCEIQQNNY